MCQRCTQWRPSSLRHKFPLGSLFPRHMRQTSLRLRHYLQRRHLCKHLPQWETPFRLPPKWVKGRCRNNPTPASSRCSRSSKLSSQARKAKGLLPKRTNFQKWATTTLMESDFAYTLIVMHCPGTALILNSQILNSQFFAFWPDYNQH